MHVVVKRYGKILEITQFEKKSTPKKVSVFCSRKSDFLYRARRPDSLRRTKQILVRRVFSAIEDFGSPLLFTLTFEGSASDAFYAKEAITRFQRRLRVKYPSSCSVFVPELSPKNRIHFHGLVFGLSQSLGNTRVRGRIVSWGEEYYTREFAALWSEGYLDITKTDGSPKLAHYLGKYVTKAVDESLFFGMRLLRFSRNFPHEIVVRDSFLCSKILKSVEFQKPVSEWEGFTHFTGRISKLKYLRK